MSFISVPCALTFYFSAATLAVIGYWALLFKSPWIHEMAIFSIAYFGIRIIFDIIAVCLISYCCHRSDKAIYIFSLEVCKKFIF